MLKKTIFLFVVLTALAGLLYKQHQWTKNKQALMDNKIHNVTKVQASQRLNCDYLTTEKRLECLKDKLTQITSKIFVSKYSLFKNHQKTELSVEDSVFSIKIKRPKELKMATGSCVVSLYFYDFDDNYIYLSKDNPSGLVVCGNDGDNFIIAPSSFTEDQAEQGAHFLKNLHF